MGFFFFFFLREPFFPFFLLLLLPLAAPLFADAGLADDRLRDEDAEADRPPAAAAAGCGDADASRLLLLLRAEEAPERDVPALPSVSDMTRTEGGGARGNESANGADACAVGVQCKTVREPHDEDLRILPLSLPLLILSAVTDLDGLLRRGWAEGRGSLTTVKGATAGSELVDERRESSKALRVINGWR